MNKKFALSTLSLAIVIASGSVQAETPQECVTDSGTGETMKEWGIWCGVETFLVSLTEQEPAAAGPAETDVDIVLGELGRGDAEEFDPNAQTTATPPIAAAPPEIQLPVTPEPEPEPEPIAPHIVLNEEGKGYLVSYDIEFPTQDTGGPARVQLLDAVDEQGRAINPRVGSLSLSLRDGCSDECDYSENPDTAAYVLFNQQGAETDRDSFEGESEEPLPGGSIRKDVDVTLNGKRGTTFSAYSESQQTTTVGDQTITDRENFHGEGSSMPVDLTLASQEYFDDLLAGYFREDRRSETSGPIPDTDNFGSVVEHSETHRAFVHGTLTPEAELNQLLSGDVTAIYGGFTGLLQQEVQFTVDFGNASFEGSFGDANSRHFTNALFGADPDFDFSFTTSGVIQGTELISTAVSTGQGFVQGSFFESNADVIGGAYKVTKAGIEYADIFATIKGFARPHIEPSSSRNNFIGYEAGFDFQGSDVSAEHINSFGLDVYDGPDTDNDSFNGYAGSSYFGHFGSRNTEPCDSTNQCYNTYTSIQPADENTSTFQHKNQTNGAEYQDQWDGYEASSNDGSNTEVLKDYWNGYHKTSNRNDEGGNPESTERYFVAGEITPLVEIQSLISDQRTLVYSGNSLNLLQSARIEVDFGNRNFDAQFGDVSVDKKTQLGIAATKNMGFNAKGVVSGTNIISTSTSADSGILQGTFFGSNAKVLGGAYDVTVGGDRIVDVFSTTQGASNTIIKQLPPI